MLCIAKITEDYELIYFFTFLLISINSTQYIYKILHSIFFILMGYLHLKSKCRTSQVLSILSILKQLDIGILLVLVNRTSTFEHSPFPLLFHSNFIISFVFKFLKT